MKKISLSKGAVTTVNDRDFARVNKHRWYYDGRYAKRYRWDKNLKQYFNVYMHRFIMDTPDGYDTDHINGDKLDNRRSNLRVCTRSQNKTNGSILRVDNKSGTQGVHYDKSRGKWVAYIKIANKFNNLGRFSNKEDAIKARSKAETKHIFFES